MGEFIQAVEAWDCQDQAWVRLDNEQCRFAYRDSVFKQQPDRYLITAIELKLPLLHDLRMDYAGIREELQAQGVELPSAVDVANAVIAIRRRKLPDPEVLGNAGSFFKNPVLPLEQVDAAAALPRPACVPGRAGRQAQGLCGLDDRILWLEGLPRG